MLQRPRDALQSPRPGQAARGWRWMNVEPNAFLQARCLPAEQAATSRPRQL